MNVLSKRLKEARKRAGLKQIEAAKKLGISNGTLSGYERNYRDPDTEMLNKMADLYGVTVDWLMGRSQDPQMTADQYKKYNRYAEQIVAAIEEITDNKLKKEIYKQTSDFVEYLKGKYAKGSK